jgi:hypothetical protein
MDVAAGQAAVRTEDGIFWVGFQCQSVQVIREKSHCTLLPLDSRNQETAQIPGFWNPKVQWDFPLIMMRMTGSKKYSPVGTKGQPRVGLDLWSEKNPSALFYRFNCRVSKWTRDQTREQIIPPDIQNM